MPLKTRSLPMPQPINKWILLGVVCSFLSPLRAETDRPNVIVLIADQLRYQSVGYAGDARA